MVTAIMHPVRDRVMLSCVIFDITTFWFLTLRDERQSARMSKITDDGLTRSGTGCFVASCTHMATVGVKELRLAISGCSDSRWNSCARPTDVNTVTCSYNLSMTQHICLLHGATSRDMWPMRVDVKCPPVIGHRVVDNIHILHARLLTDDVYDSNYSFKSIKSLSV